MRRQEMERQLKKRAEDWKEQSKNIRQRRGIRLPTIAAPEESTFNFLKLFDF